MSVDLFGLREQLEVTVAKIIKNIKEIDNDLVSGEGTFHHPHELRAMLTGVKKIAEFVLEHNMDIGAVKTARGQAIVQETLRVHRCYDRIASPKEHASHDFEDTTFFLMWLLEPSVDCQDT